MKKLLCLLILTALIVGCTSKSPAENKEEPKISDVKDIAGKEQDEDINKHKASTENKEEDTNIMQDDKLKNDTPSTNTDTSISKNNSNQSSSGNSGNSNAGGSTIPPKQETPTPPKVETPPPPVPATPIEQRSKADSVMAQINTYRQQNGLVPFIVDNYLITSSTNHAYAMAEKRALWHSGAAECITNYDDPFSAWKNSPAHNDMLLNNNRYGAVSIYFVDGYYYSVFHTSP